MSTLVSSGVSIISIEGNIGAGKSTVIERLSCNKEYLLIPEPINEWKQLLNFTKFFGKQYWYLLHCKVMNHFLSVKIKVETIKKNNVSDIKCIIIERSAKSAFEMFIMYGYLNNYCTKEELLNLFHLYHVCALDYDKVIVINTSPKTCLERIRLRNRNCEIGTPLKFIIDLEMYMGVMLEDIVVNKKYIIDGEQDIETIFNTIQEIISKK